MKLWQLKSLSDLSPLNEPQKLPENWGPIFGMSGMVDRLSDLSWLGPDYAGKGWFVVGEVEDIPQAGPVEIAKQEAKDRLRDSEWALLPDAPLTIAQQQKWIEYRDQLRNIELQPGFPNEIVWPAEPNE